VGKNYYVYILSSKSGTLYTGVTSDLVRRVWEHKHGVVNGFTKRYGVHRLVYFEETSNVEAAILREKQIKAFRRSKKLALIRDLNFECKDLSEGWYEND
jgi:putative endonuclease